MIRISVKNEARLGVIDRTLERIGIANTKTKTITPTCYLSQVGKRFYIAHFKELLSLELDTHCFESSGNHITEDDIARRDNIVALLLDWNLIELHNTVEKSKLNLKPMNFKVLKASEVDEWTINHKYSSKH